MGCGERVGATGPGALAQADAIFTRATSLLSAIQRPPHTHTPHIPPFSVSVLILRDVLLRCHPPSTLKGKGGAKWLMGWEGRRGRGWLRRLYPPWRGRPWSPRRPIGAPWFLRAAPRAYPEEREGGKGSAPLVEVGDARDGRSFVLDSFFLSKCLGSLSSS